jgi:hypothetical protein
MTSGFLRRAITAAATLTISVCVSGGEDAAKKLESLNDTPAFRANLDWHRAGKAEEIRTSWFHDGRPAVAMLCVADLRRYEVVTLREVHESATQNLETRKLSHAQVLTLTALSKELPKSIEPKQVDHLVIVSIGEGKDRELHVYDRRALPAQIVRLYDLTGANVATEEDAQKPTSATP